MVAVSTTQRPDGVAVLRISNPPVNALSSTVQRALSTQLSAALSNPEVRGVVICADSSRGFFSSGADVSEFALFTTDNPPFDLEASWIYQGAENARIPVVAAIDGVCFGGALELALCCHARVSTKRSSFGLPELRLGIIPGSGGTQRLPRLVGFEKAIEWMLKSTTVKSDLAKQSGLVDLITDSNVVDAAAQMALNLSKSKLPKSNLTRDDRVGSLYRCRAVAAHLKPIVKRLSKGGVMPHYEACLQVALFGVEHGGEAGLKEEARVFMKLVTSPTSRAIVHLFFAARQTSKVPLGNVSRPPRTITSAGVIGGGLMGAGIATAMLYVGIRVTIKELNEKFAAAARARVQRNLGKKADAMSLLNVTTQYSDLSHVDIVIEAAPEIPQLKQSIFKDLEKICRTDCIFATNTSTINVDLIGMGCPKAHSQGRLLGAHFFSPAHKMPLLEIVRTESTAPEILSDVIALAKRIKKTPLVVGNCAGFAVNRMYFPQSMVACFLVALGIDPYRIDEACEKFGLPMGPFKLVDFVGIDIGQAVGGVFNMAFADRAVHSNIIAKMLADGRKGQKSGKGFYKYEKGSRVAIKDIDGIRPLIEDLRNEMSTQNGYQKMRMWASTLSDKDIVDATLLPCVNEGTRILDEGVALRPSDLDICSVMGYAFPQHIGGLMYWAKQEHGDAASVLRRLKQFYDITNGFSLFRPSFALERSAAAGATLGSKQLPRLQSGSDNDIVIVSAYRTAVGRAGRGGFKDTIPDDMLAPVLKEILSSTNVPPEDVDDLVVGTVLQRGDTGVVWTRVAGILTGLPVSTPVRTVNRLCSSGLQAIADAAAAITAGHYDVAIAGGVETMSMASMRNTEVRPNPRVRGNAMAAGCYLEMGKTSENVVERFHVTREAQDRLAVLSHARAAVAKLSGRQSSEIVPIRTKVRVFDKATKKMTDEFRDVVVAQDEGVRLGVTADRLAKLPAVFKKGGTTTPGNSSQLSDGAAAVMLMRRSEARRRGLKPFASLKAFAVAGVEPAIMGIGPAVAIPKVLEKAGLSVDDIDLWEINEAFASQAEYCIKELGVNRDVVNVMGGAIAIGHPLGMTGARLSVSIIHELLRRKQRFGVVSMCVGSGMGAAAVYEINSDGSETTNNFARL